MKGYARYVRGKRTCEDLWRRSRLTDIEPNPTKPKMNLKKPEWSRTTMIRVGNDQITRVSTSHKSPPFWKPWGAWRKLTAIIPTAFPEVRHSRQKNEHERAKSEPKQVSVERRKKYGTALVLSDLTLWLVCFAEFPTCVAENSAHAGSVILDCILSLDSGFIDDNSALHVPFCDLSTLLQSNPGVTKMSHLLAKEIHTQIQNSVWDWFKTHSRSTTIRGH